MSTNERVAIVGAPKTGKSTYGAQLAEERGVACRSTDDVIGMGWSEASAEVSTWFDAPGPLLVEGVAVARALRKWLERNPKGKPVDELVVTTNAPWVAQSAGQASMAKGIATVLSEIRAELLRRGVEVREIAIPRR